MKPVNDNRLAWVFDQATEYAGRLYAREAAEERSMIESARLELEKYLGRKFRHQAKASRRKPHGVLP
jgi:hypothetical protein